MLAGWWLAFNHPQGGTVMRQAVSESMARAIPVHVTMWAGASGGLAFALSDRFTDLDPACKAAKGAGIGIVMAQPTAGKRPGGNA